MESQRASALQCVMLRPVDIERQVTLADVAEELTLPDTCRRSGDLRARAATSEAPVLRYC